MITSLIIFLITASIVCFMIWNKVAFMRKHNVGEELEEPEKLLAHLNIGEVKANIKYHAKIYGHRFVLIVLKQWIRFTFWVKGQRERFFPKKEIVAENQDGQDKNSLSKFVTVLHDYKNNLKHVAKKVKEREERKRDM